MAEAPKQILLIRHGRSETNSTDVYQAGDQFEIDPLDLTGQTQAAALAAEFTDQQFLPEVIVASSYLRAAQTAQYLAKATMARIVVPVRGTAGVTDQSLADESVRGRSSLFRELDLPSELAGRPFKDPVAIALKDTIQAHRYDPDWHYSDEENLHDIWTRAGECLDYLADRPEQRLAVVCHGGLIKACLARIQFGDMAGGSVRQKLEAYQAFSDHTWVDNTGVISLLKHADEQGWQWITTYNRHLGGAFGFVDAAPPAHDASVNRLIVRD